MKIINAKIDVMKVDKSKLFEGKNGAKYLDLTIFVNDDKDQYDNWGMVVQSSKKDEPKGAILGNIKMKERLYTKDEIPVNTPSANYYAEYKTEITEAPDDLPF